MSQQGIALLMLPCVASGAITLYRGVTFAGAQVSVAGTKVMGIARRSAASGTELDLVAKGTAVCEAGAAVALGAHVAMDASGRVITTTTLDSTQTGNALQAAAAAGDLIEVLLA